MDMQLIETYGNRMNTLSYQQCVDLSLPIARRRL